jgi:2-oxoacid:acceptor oxidoreductase delta subunit (pyruvate/2-ketoisovalerate family)
MGVKPGRGSTKTLTRGAVAYAGSSLALKTGDWRVTRPVHVHRVSPCSHACPAGENPQAYLALAQDDPRAAWESLVSANPMPAVTGRVCHHPCEIECNRGRFDEPVAIHAVERFLGDQALGHGWNYPVAKPAPDAPEVAVVGAGPAGLSAAYHLVRRGYNATLFEAQSEPGGLLRSAIPSYRLPRAVVERELERLLSVGIRLERNRRLGRDMILADLEKSFRAVFLAPGAERGREWSVGGVVPRDLRNGLDLLQEWLSIGALPRYERVAIIGGGNTSVDLARVLRFNGVREIHVISFRSRPGPGVSRDEVMPALPREIAQALEEGVIIDDCRGVTRLILRGEKAVGVEMVHMKKLLQRDGTRKPVAFEGTETVLHVDHVIPAIGEEVEPFGMEAVLGGRPFFKVDGSGRIEGHRGLFAGGDARLGGGTVSDAVGDGRRAAEAIDRYIRGVAIAAGTAPAPIGIADLNLNYFDRAPRAEIAFLAPASRSAETEIEGALGAREVAREGERCFSCGECMTCDNCWTLCPDNAVLKTTEPAADGSHYVFDYDYCKGCGLCARECPVGFIAMVQEP